MRDTRFFFFFLPESSVIDSKCVCSVWLRRTLATLKHKMYFYVVINIKLEMLRITDNVSNWVINFKAVNGIFGLYE